MRTAVLDLGSNTFHLVVADVDGRSVTTVFRSYRMLRLGRAVTTTGAVPDADRARAIAAVTELSGLARAHGATRLLAVATAALRDASNGPQVVAALGEAAGTEIHTLTGVEEARWSYLGVRASVPSDDRPLLVVDLGGGSLELAVGQGEQVAWSTSTPLGATALTAQVGEGALGASSLAALHRRVDDALDRPLEELARLFDGPDAGSDTVGHPAPTTVTVGGPVRALARIVAHQDAVAQPDEVHGQRLTLDRLRRLRDELVDADPATRSQLPGMTDERADHVHVAAVVLARLLQRSGIDEVVVAATGLREGLLLHPPTDEHGGAGHGAGAPTAEPRPRTGLRPRYVRRVTPDHIRERVSVRHLVDDADRGPTPTDVVGRLVGMDDQALLVVGRDGLLRVIDTSTVVSSRVVPAHPRLPAEPDVGTPERPLVRSAARVLLLAPDDRVLLVAHAPDDDRVVWTAPGGGLEPDEDHAAAAQRELAEEIGVHPAVGPWVWHRRVTFSFRSVWIDQEERWFLARSSDAVDAATAPLRDHGALRARWWSVAELRTTTDEVAPAALATHLQRLLDHGPPDRPVDVGR